MQAIPPPPFGADEDPVRVLLDTLEADARKIGLYVEGAQIASMDESLMQQVAEGTTTVTNLVNDGNQVVLMVAFAIGDLAFSKMATDPAQHEIDKQAQVILPDAAEELREKIRKATEEGKDIFDIDPTGGA